jgi:UrcA family protein
MNTSINRSLISFGRGLVLVLAAGSALGVTCAGTAHAADVPSISVSYKDLDLTRPADAQVLYARLQRAARAACDTIETGPALQRRAAFERCYSAALASAVQQVNAPQVLALHQAATTSQHG